MSSPRDWKAINARRRTAQAAEAGHVSRYQIELITRIHRLVGDKFDGRLLSGELSPHQVYKIILERELSQLSQDEQKLYWGAEAHREIRKHWRCIAKALRQCGIQEERLLPAACAIIREIIDKDKGITER